MKCPTCFRPVPPERVMLSCAGSCGAERRASLHQEYGVDVPVKPVFPVEQGACRHCKTPSNVEACPACHSVIPVEFRMSPTPQVTCIAMAGARTTGKSIYLGVLKQQLEILAEKSDSVLEMIGDTAELYARRYGDLMYKERRVLPPTAEISKDFDAYRPLIYRYVDHLGRHRILVFRDVAGEDLEDLKNRQQRLLFVARADAVITLLDLQKIPEIHTVLRGLIDGGELGGDGFAVLQQIIELLRVAAPPGGGPVLAVTLSKVDTLHAVADHEAGDLSKVMVRPGSPLRRDPSTRDLGYDKVDSDLLHEEIRSLMRLLSVAKIDNILKQTGQVYKYFAVSSLGKHTDGQSIDAAGIAPFRVLDPVKWIIK